MNFQSLDKSMVIAASRLKAPPSGKRLPLGSGPKMLTNAPVLPLYRRTSELVPKKFPTNKSVLAPETFNIMADMCNRPNTKTSHNLVLFRL